MRNLPLLFVALTGLLSAQTTVYLRTPGPAGAPMRVTGASNESPIVIQTATPHGLSADDLIHIYLVEGNFAANGIWKVKEVIDATHFSIKTLAGMDVAGSGSFRARGLGLVAGWVESTVERVTPYTLRDHPRVLLDGPAGEFTKTITTPPYTSNSNPAWTGLLTSARLWRASNWSNNLAANGGMISPAGGTMNAIEWLVTGNSAARDVALDTVQQVERITYGAMTCDETSSQCGYPAMTDYPVLSLFDWAQAYTIVRSELTPSQRKTIADKMLNDIRDPGGCIKNLPKQGAGTITSANGSPLVTGTGTAFTTELAPGMLIWMGPSLKVPIQIASIQDDTHLKLTYNTYAIAGTDYAYKYSAGGWTPGQCGLMWVVNHHTVAIMGDPVDYPSTGGQSNIALNNGNNMNMVKATAQIHMNLALADDDWRAIVGLADAYSWLYNYGYRYIRDWYTGHNSAGNHYTSNRTGWDLPSFVIAFQHSVVNGPDFKSGLYLSRHMPMWYTHWLPWSPNTPVNFGEPNGGIWSEVGGFRGIAATSWLYRDTDDAKRLNYWMDTIWGLVGSEVAKGNSDYKMWYYLFLDPSRQRMDLNATPTQYLFRSTDDSFCAVEGWPCDPTKQLAALISRTGYHSTSDTVAYLEAHVAGYFDHDGPGDPGGYRIYRNVPLMTGDGGSLNSIVPNSNTIELGGGNNWQTAAGNIYRYSKIIRWAGVDPTGDPQSRYVYAQVELKDAYKATMGATRVQRHFVHLKKPGTQDFVIVYDDVATAIPGMKRGFLHFRKSAGSTFSFASPDAVLTAPNARLLTRVLSPAGPNLVATYIDNADGSYPGGSGFSYRVSICGSEDGSVCSATATQAEWLVVHEPVTSTSATMPPTTLLSTTPGMTGVQIGGSDPKIALFARGGLLSSAVVFATSFSGTAQVLVSGLAPGIYVVTRDGATVLSGVPVKDQDNVLYFESSSGTFQISLTGVLQPVAVVASPPPDGMVGVPYAATFLATGGAPPYTWSISRGSLPDGLSITSDGILQGTPSVSRQYSFTVQVQDSIGSTATADEMITIAQPPPSGLQITVEAVTANSAITRYGVPGLDANEVCALQLASDSAFNALVETYTDAGGGSVRTYIFGEGTALAESTTYYASVTCGIQTAQTQFTTLAANAEAFRSLPLMVNLPARLGIETMLVE